MLSLETFVQQPASNEQHILKFLAGDDTLKPLAWVFKDFQVYYTVHCSQSGSPAEILAEGSLASGSVNTTAYRASTTDAVGWTLQRFHAAVSLDIQMFQSPAFPTFPKLHLNLIIDETVENCNHQPLERSKGELSKKLHKAQHPSGVFISNKGKDDLMGSQEWDQCQGRLGQPAFYVSFAHQISL